VQERAGEVVGCGDDNVGGGVMGRDSCCGEPCQGVGHAFGVGTPGPYPITSVMARGWPWVPTLYRVWGPCAADFRLCVNEYLGSQRGEGRSVEIKRAIRVGLSGELGVDTREPKEVQGK
jgi:hypothetical protein